MEDKDLWEVPSIMVFWQKASPKRSRPKWQRGAEERKKAGKLKSKPT